MRPTVSDLTTDVYYTLGPALTAGDEAAGWPLLLFVDAICSPMAELDAIAGDQADGSPGWGALLDVDRCPDWALDWLGQFVGVVIPPNVTDPTRRRDVVRAAAGLARGTLAAIIAAAQPYLDGPRRVEIVERDTSPYHFSLTIYEADLLGPTYDQLAAQYSSYDDLSAAFAIYDDIGSTPEQVESAVLAAKPAGLVMSFTSVP